MTAKNLSKQGEIFRLCCNIPASLRIELKMMAFTRNKPLQELVGEILQDYVDKHRDKPDGKK